MARMVLASCPLLAAIVAVATGAQTPRTETPLSQQNEAQGGAPMVLKIESPAFAANERIPRKFSGDGNDISPALSWSGAPTGTKELALVCDDPDAPTPEPWVHWVIYKIPASAKGLPENVDKIEGPKAVPGARQGKNSWNRLGYGGPAPPPGHGTHHYHFKLYALDTELILPAAPDKKQLLAAMKGHILAEGEVVGTYER